MVDNPITRKEKYLAKLTGSYTGNVPDPITRVEKYLYDLCQKGISGLTPEEIENAVNKYLEGKDYVTKTDADKAYQPAGSYLSGTDEDLAVSGKAADAKAVGNAVAKIEGINYTDRGTLADTDAFLVNDGTGMKKSVLSKLSDFVLNKIADKVFAKLQTNDKTILGAINELNSKAKIIISKTNVTNLEELVNSDISMNAFVLFHLAGARYIGNDLPSNENYKYGSGIIFYRNTTSCKIILIPESEKPVWKMSTQEKWKDFENNIVN